MIRPPPRSTRTDTLFPYTTLFRSNLVQKRNVDAIIGYISSGSCAALTPVAEERKTLTVFAICGTPRIFEDASRRYIFRTMSHASSDGVDRKSTRLNSSH